MADLTAEPGRFQYGTLDFGKVVASNSESKQKLDRFLSFFIRSYSTFANLTAHILVIRCRVSFRNVS